MILTIYGLTLDCEFEHEPAEPATETDPGWPAVSTLLSAKLGGVDIVKIMDLGVIQELERQSVWS